MEEKRPGEHPLDPVAGADPVTANRSARPGIDPDVAGAEDPAELAAAQRAGQMAEEEMAERGFGNDKGTDGF